MIKSYIKKHQLVKTANFLIFGGLVLSLVTTAQPAIAQNFNVDFCKNNGWVSSSFGGPANQPGDWNKKTAFGGPLVDINGNSTNVTMTPVGGGPCLSLNNPNTSGQDEALMDDFWDIGATNPVGREQIISGLSAGIYQVYTLAWRSSPGSPTGKTSVDINGIGPQVIGGAWTGSYQQGITHAFHTVTIAPGDDMIIHWKTDQYMGAANGLQIRKLACDQTVVYEAGSNNNFATSPDTPPAVPSPGALANFNLKGFDDATSNKYFAHWFNNLQIPGKAIVGARLEIKAKAHADIPSNDNLHLRFFDNYGNDLYSIYTVNFDLLNGGTWNSGNANTFTLDIGNLPPTGSGASRVNELNYHGFLDVVVQDDTAIDYLKLTVDYKCTCAQPPANMVAWWPLDETSGTTSADIVNSNDGNHQNGPVPVPGMVNGALQFDGVNDYVKVPHDNFLNFGEGDLSIDAWIYHEKNASGVETIVDKRYEDPVSSTQGYSFYLYNGQLGFQLATGNGTWLCGNTTSNSCTNYILSGSNLADGLWHHVAVTVDRDNNPNPQGGTWYIDGNIMGNFNPLLREGNLSNREPLTIGRNTNLVVTSNFRGKIDEVELFNRELQPQEIGAIFDAKKYGKCKESVHVPWDRRPCRGQNSVTINATVCNNSLSSQTYQVSSIVPSSFSAQCNFNLTPPIIHNVLTPQPLTVNQGQCAPFQIKIDVPAGISSSDTACYTAIVNNVNTGLSLSNEGSILGPNKWCVYDGDDTIFAILALSQTTPVTIMITNDGDTADTLDYTIVPVRSDMDESLEVSLSLNDQKPGIGISGALSLEAGETGEISFKAALTQANPFSVNEAILMTDLDGDRTQEPLYSTAFLYKAATTTDIAYGMETAHAVADFNNSEMTINDL